MEIFGRGVLFSFSAFVVSTFFSSPANALSLGGVVDNGPGDLDPRVGSIIVKGDVDVSFGIVVPGLEVDVDSTQKVSNTGASLAISGVIENRSDQGTSFTLTDLFGFALDVEVPREGFIFANLDASLFEIEVFGLPTSNGVDADVLTIVEAFAPSTAFAGASIPSGQPLDQENRLFAREVEEGMLLQNSGTLFVEVNGFLGPDQRLVFNNSFEGGFRVPEPVSSLAIMFVGVLGVVGMLQRGKSSGRVE